MTNDEIIALYEQLTIDHGRNGTALLLAIMLERLSQRLSDDE